MLHFDRRGTAEAGVKASLARGRAAWVGGCRATVIDHGLKGPCGTKARGAAKGRPAFGGGGQTARRPKHRYRVPFLRGLGKTTSRQPMVDSCCQQ